MNRSPLRTLSAAFLVALGPLAQAQAQPQPPAPAPPAEPAYVTHKEFRTKLFTVKHRDPWELVRGLRPLGSGAKGADMVPNSDISTIAVRDFPENIAAIEEALRRLDVPAPEKRNVSFRVHVLFATHGPAPEGALPEDLKPVVAALKSTLAYRHYTQAATLLVRGQAGTRGLSAKGAAEMQVQNAKGETHAQALPFVFSIDQFKVEPVEGGPALVHLDKMTFEFYGGAPEWQTKLQSNLTLKEGEKVVVGTSTLKHQGVVVVIAAELPK